MAMTTSWDGRKYHLLLTITTIGVFFYVNIFSSLLSCECETRGMPRWQIMDWFNLAWIQSFCMPIDGSQQAQT